MESQIKEILKPVIGDDIDEEIIKYVLQIKQEDDFDEFLGNVIDSSNPDHALVYDKLKSVIFGKQIVTSTKQIIPETDRGSDFKTRRSTKEKTHRNNQNPNWSSDKQPENGFKMVSDNGTQNMPNISSLKIEEGSHSAKGKKTNYVSFDAYSNTPALKKGRHPCNCEAKKHALINNCLKCGRIVCEQEGSGPCFFCDNMVCTKAEMEILNSNSKESNKLYNRLNDQKKSKEWKKAIEMRNRLISTDRLGDVKNKVYDDQSDYFDMNSPWLTKEEKEKLKKSSASIYSKMPRSKAQMKIALDLASRMVYAEQDEFTKNKSKLLTSVNKLLDATERRFPKNLFEGDKETFLKEFTKAVDENSGPSKILIENNKKEKTKVLSIPSVSRTVNSDLLEHVDRGMCLSMHQPWASLLVAGIKVHEGRTWKTDHRGRLWIHAGSKEPEDEEILACEELYKSLYDDSTLQFPKKYPTSCLLGCVYVEDCLPQKEYREKYPNGESNSPYVLICSNPMVLPIFLPMSGQHKIFPLNKEIHRQAKEALMASTWI